jgi:hypothetical protein
MRIDELRPVLGIVDDLPGLMLAILNRTLGVALGLQNLLNSLFSLWR